MRTIDVLEWANASMLGYMVMIGDFAVAVFYGSVLLAAGILRRRFEA